MILDSIKKINRGIEEEIQYKIDHKTKPVGSLGQLEKVAKQIALIQQTTTPHLTKPTILTVASDHHIVEEGVASAPPEITWQQILNFQDYGGGIGFLCKANGLELKLVDAGINREMPSHPMLIDAKVRMGTRNFLHEPAMTTEECNRAFTNGIDIAKSLIKDGSNIIGFGEMGIGNTTPATAILAAITGKPVSQCVGPGGGIPPKGVAHKQEVIEKALAKHGSFSSPMETLRHYGGLEIATIAGAMYGTALNGATIIVDGFITTAAAMIAYALDPKIKDYMIFSHTSEEGGHRLMIDFIEAKPILNLQLRLGEGTGAALAYPIIDSAVKMLTYMTSFNETVVSDTSELTRI